MRVLFLLVFSLFSSSFFAQTPEPCGMNIRNAIDYDGDGQATFDIGYFINDIRNKTIAINPTCNLSNMSMVLHKFSDDSIIPNSPFLTSSIQVSVEVLDYLPCDLHCNNTITFEGLLVLPITDDSDYDGVLTINEDLNGNGNLYDDDTDSDGISNFEDLDDDNDGVNTTNEDYNRNGNFQDDDINSNGIPDYLDPTAFLSIIKNQLEKVIIYPNPVKNNFKVQLPNSLTTKLNISIYNSLGKVVYEKTTLDSETVINNELASGIYIVKIKADNHFITRKLVIN